MIPETPFLHPVQSELDSFVAKANAGRGDLISGCQGALRKKLFTNRSQLHPRSVAGIATQDADVLIGFISNPATPVKEHGTYLCNQGLSSESVFALSQAHFEFYYAVVGNDRQIHELFTNFQSMMLEGFFNTREKLILNEQESFRMAFQMALDYSSSQVQAARQAVQDAIEASYRNVILAQENERRRISRELHDEAGQALIGLHMNLENLLKEDASEDTFKRRTVEKAIALTDNVFKGIRRLAYNLRPPMLDLLGVNLAIKQLCLEFAEQTHLAVNYVGIEIPSLADEYAITVYRVAQESLTNIHKYANSKHVWVKLGRNEEKITLMVKDDGKGFAIDTVKKGLGLVGMQERLRLLNGEFNIESVRGKYTRIDVVLPLVLKIVEKEPSES